MLGMMEAILFACGDPIDIDKLAQALNTEEENVLELSRTLQAKYNKEESGIHLLQLDHTLQFAVNPVFLAPVRTALDLRSSAPLSQAAAPTCLLKRSRKRASLPAAAARALPFSLLRFW